RISRRTAARRSSAPSVERSPAGASSLPTRLHRLLEQRPVLAVPGLLQLRERNEPQRGRVDAVAEPVRAGAVGNDVAEMRITLHCVTSYWAGVSFAFISSSGGFR